MSSLLNLLNPEDEVHFRVPARCPGFEQALTNDHFPSPTPNNSEHAPTDGSDYSKGKEVPPDHEYHPDCPDTLACLPDTDGRPQHTLPVILRCAILGSPRKRLTIREIYAAMEEKYPYYKTAGPTWKQSVRHHLSLNRLFERQPRPPTDPGFGSYWTVNLSAPPGTKRPRKRGRPNKGAQGGSGPPIVRKRGRPRKDRSQTIPAESSNQHVLDEGYTCDLTLDEDGDLYGYVSEDYESDYDVIHPFDRHSSMPGPGIFGSLTSSASFTLQPARFTNAWESSDHVIDRMQIEMAGLRRQSAEAASVSLRLQDQLAEAQAEASRAKATLRMAESMLEEESRKRQEAEKFAEEERRGRRAAEVALKSLQIRSQNLSPT